MTSREKQHAGSVGKTWIFHFEVSSLSHDHLDDKWHLWIVLAISSEAEHA